MRPRLTLLGIAGLIACTALASRVCAQTTVPDAEEAFLSFQSIGGEVVITALYRADSVYLPLGELFDRLRLDYAYDSSKRVVHGFYIHQDETYEIDLENLTAHRKGEQIRLDPRDFIVSSGEVYVAPPVLARLFGLNADVDLRELTLRVTSPEPLPAERLLERERRHADAGLPETLQPHAPLRFPRNPSLFNGGALQYTLNAVTAAQGSMFAADVMGAAEVLGGDLQASYRTGFGEIAGEPEVDARWRYVFGEDNKIIQQVQLGSLTTRTLHHYEVTGVRVTNEPVNARTRLGTYLVVGETRPNWEVELHLNGELIDFGRADEHGRFRFQVPLSYGGSLFSLKYYGPKGEVVVDDRRIDVPPLFVPAGTLEYDLSAGRAQTLGRSLAQARVHYGLTNWLTTGLGAEYVGGMPGRRPIYYQTTNIRLPESFTVGLEAAPGHLYRGTLQGAFPSLAYFSGSASRAEKDPIYNPTGARERLSGRAFAPVRLFGAPLGLTVSADRTAYWTGGRSQDLRVDVLLNLARLKPSIGHTVTRFTDQDRTFLQTNQLNLALFFAPSVARRGPRIVGDLLFDLAADYDLSGHVWQLLRFEVARSVTRAARATLAFERHPRLDENRLELRYQLDLTSFRSTTAARTGSTGGLSVSQSVRGAVVVDPRQGYVGASARDQVGRAGATFRMFFDNNGDGAFTSGEPVIPGGAVRFRHSASVRPTSTGLLRAEDLLPYYRYTVHVDPTQLPNPLWLPEYDTFSFVSDPNSFKAIDIPFYAGAVVEGRLQDAGEPGQHHMAGLRVQLRRLDGTVMRAVETFSDGAFYAIGVPPGEYEARLDEDQLRRIGRVADPPSRRFTVRTLPDGDAVSEIDFMLRPAPTPASGDRP